jgi:hypothetical protein
LTWGNKASGIILEASPELVVYMLSACVIFFRLLCGLCPFAGDYFPQRRKEREENRIYALSPKS